MSKNVKTKNVVLFHIYNYNLFKLKKCELGFTHPPNRSAMQTQFRRPNCHMMLRLT